jgi:anaerobic magnesium-protoporphyrin IX monomethyl ester cyclase
MKIVMVQGKYFNSWEAIGLGYIGSYIKKKFHNINISFYHGCFDSCDCIVKGCIGADIVLFSCTSPSFKYCVDLANKIKKKNNKVHTVIGGYHPSALPNGSLVEGIDQVVVGEGEAAVVDIINGNRDSILHGRRMNFNELDWPDRDLIKNNRNIEVAYKENGIKITSFQSVRSCPFKCVYCADGSTKTLYRGGKVERRDVSDLVSEMVYVKDRYGLDLIKFSDPTWNTSLKYVKDFCREKIGRGLSVPFLTNIHARIVDDEMFKFMKLANCNEIALGVESGSPKILSQIGKTTTRGDILNAVKLSHSNGIKVRGYFILGMPDETEEDLLLTEKFAEELDLEEYGFTILCPYPGTMMFNENPDKFKDIDWSSTDEYINYFWKTNYVSNERLREWQNRLTKKFMNRITWHNKILLEGE